jgi:flagellar assembly protein FliH
MTSSDAGRFVPLGGGGVPAVREFRPLTPTSGRAPAAGAAAVEGQGRPGETPPAEPKDELRRAFQAGYESAREELASQVESTIAESFVKAIEELGAFRARLRDRYERELLEVALGVARKVVQQELAERPEIWLGMIRAAVQRAVERERIVVRVPPALAGFLRERAPELHATLEDVRELQVVEDPALPPTGCVLESRMGDVDIGVDTQIDAARTALLRAEE